MTDPLMVPALTAGFPRNLGKKLDNWQFGITVREVHEYADSYLLRLPGVGRKAVDDIRTHIAKMEGVVKPTASPNFLARNSFDLALLQTAVTIVPKEERPSFAASIIEHDLMRGPWWFQLLVGIIRLRGNVHARLHQLYIRHPEMADELVKDTAHHVLHGKDREDADSKGGFSQREVNILAGVLRDLLLKRKG